MGDSRSQLCDVTRLQQSRARPHVIAFYIYAVVMSGPIIRRYRILGRITHLSDTLPTLTEDNRPPAGITSEGTDLPVEFLAVRRWGVHRPRSLTRSLIPVRYLG